MFSSFSDQRPAPKKQPVSKKKRFSPAQIMVAGFAGVILLGALILMLPVSSAEGVVTPFLDALFTSTTSVCVTGLVVRDTGSYWSSFGQVVILLLIQIGGLGVVTVAASMALLSGRRIGLFQRSTMQEAASATQLGGIVRLTKFILNATFGLEALGAVLMAPVFVHDFGVGRGIWMSIFHSISAFCNAGIDLMGTREAYSSFTSYAANPIINIALYILIVGGGLGFLTWDDIRTHGIHLKKYRMQSKVILVTSGVLIVIPAVAFFFLEFSGLPLGERILVSLFQSITTRTAGMNTADLAAMSEPGQLTMILLMLVGGSPGSTAGGFKTTTVAVIFASCVAVFRRRDAARMFGRRIAQDTVSTAATLISLYAVLCIGCGMFLSWHEGLPLLTCLFESASAIATVGLTLGITPTLHAASKCVLICLMFFGRVGGLTLIYAALSGTKKEMGRYPLDKITVG